MNGLEFEFERFKEQALGDLPEADIEGARRIFFCGALAQANRILGLLDSELPGKRKQALLRRIARECEGFQREFIKAARVDNG